MSGRGVPQTVGSEATGPLITIADSRPETVEVAFSPLDLSNQGLLFLSKRRDAVLFRLLTDLLHFHGYSLLLKYTAGMGKPEKRSFSETGHPWTGYGRKQS